MRLAPDVGNRDLPISVKSGASRGCDPDASENGPTCSDAAGVGQHLDLDRRGNEVLELPPTCAGAENSLPPKCPFSPRGPPEHQPKPARKGDGSVPEPVATGESSVSRAGGGDRVHETRRERSTRAQLTSPKTSKTGENSEPQPARKGESSAPAAMPVIVSSETVGPENFLISAQ